MDNMQQQLNSILGDPDMMQKIMSMAQSLGQSQQEQPSQSASVLPDMDLSMLQKLSALAGKSSIDSDQRTLLQALAPYLSAGRIAKLEKAMRAAKLAGVASLLLEGSGFPLPLGR